MRCTVTLLFAALYIAAEGRSVNKQPMHKRSGDKCSANNRTYNNGDNIIYHNITTPVQHALCTSCVCSAGVIDNCYSMYCDVGVGSPVEVCEQWTTGVEGECCPRCECVHNGVQKSVNDNWKRQINSGACYECSCQESGVHCTQVYCMACSGVEVPVAGKCCPECHPATSPFFTIPVTTAPTQSTPFWPPPGGFPWRDEEYVDGE